MPSTGRPFITNRVPFEEIPLGKDGRFTRPWHDYFVSLSQRAADTVLFFRNSELIGPQVGASAFEGQTNLMMVSGSTADSSSGGFVPVFLAAGETFTVPEDTQALFAMTIDNEGTLVVDGYLVQVD